MAKYPCFYCSCTDHKATACTSYPTYSQRMAEIQRRNLCRNCGASNHQTAACPCGPCRNCGKQGHHTSICRQLEKKERGTQQAQSDSKPKTQETKKTQRKHTTTSVVTVVTQPPSCKLGQDTVLHTSIRQPKLVNVGKVDLLVLVYMILDTGADRSFITATYAEQLGLDETGTSQLKIRTFGSDTPIEKCCTTTCIQIEDRRGIRHNITVAMVDFISGELQRTPLDEADRNYLSQHDISLSIPNRVRKVAPQILIGCGDLFDLFDDGFASTHELPSVLHSKIGYLVTGRNRNTTEEPRTQVNNLCTVQSEDLNDELSKWDKFWTLDSAGIGEYMGPKSQEIEEQNQKIWSQFRETAQYSDNKYFVRLPWKAPTDDLPGNRAIAPNRLRSVITKLKEPHLLSQYHSTFQEQLSKGIIEEVDENREPDGPVIHYLAHQPVVTPHKDTTKLRAVFDGSAHYKNAPCLNDKLHQSPVILPSLVDILNRFRIGNIAIVSDVEKAFLQVHLQAIDRNATRCIWVKDIDKPLNRANIVTYRFTRVTFGLNCSPFLLGATIKQHLERTHNFGDREIAKSPTAFKTMSMWTTSFSQPTHHKMQSIDVSAQDNYLQR
ncbi:hypothetical protein RB195_022090 [Necator americanus]|uniref:CCHC-type domain-containing protein n=1 Tax=Necator americanus TaxID=51031 RepID=A0ABR1EE73_NECAM